MLDVRGKPLLRHLLATLRECGVEEAVVVRGYRKEAIAADGIVAVDNDAHAETGEAASLACALPWLRGETVVVYGDVLFRRYILETLLESAADVTIVVDSARRSASNPRDLISATVRDCGLWHDDEPALLTGIAAAPMTCCGEWIGLMLLSAQGAAWVRAALEEMRAEGVLDRADMPAVLERLARQHPVRVHYITGHWLDVDTPTDLAEARNFS
jgi:phosphoenolpyruvate phosphomutase